MTSDGLRLLQHLRRSRPAPPAPAAYGRHRPARRRLRNCQHRHL